MTEPAVVVQKAYDWVLWITPKVEKLPKSYRFSIGQSLITASIDLLLNLVDATYQSRNALPTHWRRQKTRLQIRRQAPL